MKKYEGITLVELLLYITLTTLVVGGLSTLLITVLQMNNKSDSINEVNANANQTVAIIEKEIREAKSIQTPATAGSTTTSLSLTRQNNQVVSFQITSNVITITEGATTYDLTNNQVEASTLQFKRLSGISGSTSIAFNFTLTRKNNNNTNDFSYQNTYNGAQTNE